MKIIIKFKKEIFVLIFAGITILVIAYFLAPDRSEQTLNTITSLGVLLVMIPLLFIMLFYVMNKRQSINK